MCVWMFIINNNNNCQAAAMKVKRRFLMNNSHTKIFKLYCLPLTTVIRDSSSQKTTENYNNHHSKFDSGVYFIEISAWLSNFFPLQRASSLAVLPLLKKCYVESSMLLTSPLGHRNDWILINLFVFCSYVHQIRT